MFKCKHIVPLFIAKTCFVLQRLSLQHPPLLFLLLSLLNGWRSMGNTRVWWDLLHCIYILSKMQHKSKTFSLRLVLHCFFLLIFLLLTIVVISFYEWINFSFWITMNFKFAQRKMFQILKFKLIFKKWLNIGAKKCKWR